jgi:pilus assembly protein CpaB
MKNNKTLIALGVSVLGGLVAVVLVGKWASYKWSISVVPVVVAANDIAAGERLSTHNLRRVEWPKSAIVRGSESELAVFDGRVTAYAINAGEPVLESRLAGAGTRPGLTALIANGKRAMTVKVNEVIGVAGFALPGNYVDILVSAAPNGTPPLSRIVLERVLVLAIAQDHQVKDETKPRVVSAVTLEVTPEQAERLDLARSIGSLSMILRNQTDGAPTNSRGTVVADILKGPPSLTAPAVRRERRETPPPEPARVELIRGVQRSTLVIQ